jgi:hypothetical protein
MWVSVEMSFISCILPLQAGIHFSNDFSDVRTIAKIVVSWDIELLITVNEFCLYWL